MNIHVSVDDVILSLTDLRDKVPKSVFDVGIFSLLKELNEQFDVRFSLYAYDDFKGDYFHVSDLPEKYWDEMLDCGFVRVGFHGAFVENRLSFAERCDRFYTHIPEALRAQTVRIHRYSLDAAGISHLRKYGVKELLCRDDESFERLNALPSYTLSEDEFYSLSDGPLEKDGIVYRKTDIQMDLFSVNGLELKIKKLTQRRDATAVIFLHEKSLLQSPELIITALEILQKHEPKYIF